MSQAIGYRMCHISEQMFQLIIGTSQGKHKIYIAQLLDKIKYN
jgi:hypothetical protein